MIHIYAGFDPREEIGYHAFCSSVIHRASEPVSITPLHADTIRGYYRDRHQGTNAFTHSRFLVPFLRCWQGWAIFADGADMICRADIAELLERQDQRMAVQVVQHDYKTRHPRKYIGTDMECENQDYPAKNWSSLMLINCAHPSWRCMTPDGLTAFSGNDLQQFRWLPDHFMGTLPAAWNWLVDEFGPNPDAKILHWTAGIPAFPHYANAPMADEWAAAATRITHATR